VIPYGRQEIIQDDIDAVTEVLKSDFLTQGEIVPEFENRIAQYCSANFAVAVNSATSALHLACLSLGLGKGDWLWTSPNSFVASANCGLYCGAKIDFVDIDPMTYNMSVESLEKKLVKAKINKTLPKIIIPVHFAGQSCEMKLINNLSKEYGFKVIEDASHAIGGQYLNEAVGSCKYSDITVFSFHPVKIITTAEGGLITTNSKPISEKIALLRSHGITRDNNLLLRKDEGSWYYEQIDLGLNYRMNELQAALGISQLKRLDEFIEKRHNIKTRYDDLLNGLPLQIPYQSDNVYSSLHLYPILLNLSRISKSHLKVFNELRDSGVGVNLHYIPIHLQPYYQNFGFKEGDFPNAEDYYSREITLPLFSSMSLIQHDKVIEILWKVLS
jgi:UDP-4-amino-4,6-dideoxy-N-acetyl-beta-L-altrosamine transaminase